MIENQRYVLSQIAGVLNETRRAQCIKKAKELQSVTGQSGSMAFRNLGLKPHEIVAIADILAQEKDHVGFIASISFSYNHLMGDDGAATLVKSLPQSILEIGLVNCGIGDKGGKEILKWMRKSSRLSMICIEQNNFSDQLKSEFSTYQKENPQTLVVT